MWTCVLDCAYAYGATGTILDLSDPTSPGEVSHFQALTYLLGQELTLAKALVALGDDLRRARRLAASARTRYAELGPQYAPQVDAIDEGSARARRA